MEALEYIYKNPIIWIGILYHFGCSLENSMDRVYCGMQLADHDEKKSKKFRTWCIIIGLIISVIASYYHFTLNPEVGK